MSAPAAKTVTRTPFKKWCDENVGLLFLIPWIIGFVVFKLYPFATSLFYSFTDMNFFDGITKYGLMNYIYIFHQQENADLVHHHLPLCPHHRSPQADFCFVHRLHPELQDQVRQPVPYHLLHSSILGGSVAIAVLWKALFKEDGIINMLLSFIGIQGPSWLADPDYAMVVIIVLRVWQFGSAMVLFLAALKGVSVDLYEAATIDGASKTRQFFSITVPMITPVIFYNLVTQIAQAFQEFNGPYIIFNNGGPRGSVTLVSLLVYNYAFKSNEMGMACAMAWVMFIIIALLTVIAFGSQKHWVYYAD